MKGKQILIFNPSPKPSCRVIKTKPRKSKVTKRSYLRNPDITNLVLKVRIIENELNITQLSPRNYEDINLLLDRIIYKLNPTHRLTF